ncbi:MULTISPECIES: hypothetical protein [Streptomyces]|uniref:Zn-dependent alcohol dehydrogenase n=1 Tax=Streptomyces clavifer TaxID=68188 RepID=A0ABS4V4R0_9ACTN|nr:MULTISPECIES: hypothetical protein [Streptomyces]KQX80958.1 hypothetical protein ASD26_04440 [Streptomyces sp. Root1319]KQZ07071.1 hypothetical protein ASD51_12600 [Streptomyces sp. Root55]MBP2358903.1 Zn-dependent alcohol dehydrogenase [Streptomyces clavifer]MDX2745581.1 hypothetical protein [Streptomyces sp. NRRL_B-2557]MDX3062422.1 hypothetical protein [Streptomyces sp. ND04-05B]
MSAMAKKAKNFKKSKSGVYVSLGTTAFGALSVVKQARMARQDSDTLRLIDAAVSAAAIVTGLAILYRELKRLGDDDVLLG